MYERGVDVITIDRDWLINIVRQRWELPVSGTQGQKVRLPCSVKGQGVTGYYQVAVSSSPVEHRPTGKVDWAHLNTHMACRPFNDSKSKCQLFQNCWLSSAAMHMVQAQDAPEACDIISDAHTFSSALIRERTISFIQLYS